MANMELITSVTVGSGGAASVTLPATGTIPQTYTDLKLVYSARATVAGTQEFINISFNGNTSNYSLRSLQGDGSAASSNNWSFRWIGYAELLVLHFQYRAVLTLLKALPSTYTASQM